MDAEFKESMTPSLTLEPDLTGEPQTLAEEDTALQEEPQPVHPVMEAVEMLPPEQKILILLHYREGHSLQQMSDELHIRIGTVKSRMRNARKALSRTLLIEWEEKI